MDFLKELFGEEALTWEQFSEAVTSKGFKVADLSKGNYVSKKKFDDEIKTRDTTISELNSTISVRDNDIEDLKQKLETGGQDNETKVKELLTQISTLQSQYESDKSELETKLSKQAYEFAVRDFANSQKFTSTAAKRDFEREMISAELTMKDNSIIGANDFVTSYKEKNADAFVTAEPEPTPEPKPTFIQPTPPTPTSGENPFDAVFNFNGVR